MKRTSALILVLVCALFFGKVLASEPVTRGDESSRPSTASPLESSAAIQEDARKASPWQDAQSTTGPTPPPGVDVVGAGVTSQAAVVIPNVPAYEWHHGCGPTAAGMVIGYWDGQGYGALVPGNASSQTSAVDEMIASEGSASNYTDYCVPMDDSSVNPAPLPDKSEPPTGDEHSDECVADYMKTSQSAHSNYYGWSWFSHMGAAMLSYAEQYVNAGYDATVSNLPMWNGALDWSRFRAEIDAGRPLVLLVDTDGNGSTDHFVTAIGYDTVGSTNMYACLNTWSRDVLWHTFQKLGSGRPWGIYGATTFQIQGSGPTSTPTRSPTPTVTPTGPTPTATRTPSATITPVEIPVSTDSGHQLLPAVANNTRNGEYLVVWQERQDNADIYAQRFSYRGQPLGLNIHVSTAAKNQERPAVAYSTASNEYLVVYQSGDGEGPGAAQNHIYGQRITWDGGRPGGARQLSELTDWHVHPDIAYNSQNDEFLVVWQNGTVDVLGQRVAGTGDLVDRNLYICTAHRQQNYPSIAYNPHANEYLVVWDDHRSNTRYDIYGRRVSGGGVLQGSDIPISTAREDHLKPEVGFCIATNEYLVAWPDGRLYPDLYGQIVTEAGYLNGSTLNLATDPWGDLDPGIAFNPLSGEYLVVWARNYYWDIMARRISTSGIKLGSEITVCGHSEKQHVPVIALNPHTGGYLVAWEDYRNSNADIYAYVYPGSGVPGPTATPTRTLISAPTPTRTSTATLEPWPTEWMTHSLYLPVIVR